MASCASVCPLRWLELRGSAAARRTPRGQRRPRHEGGSCDQVQKQIKTQKPDVLHISAGRSSHLPLESEVLIMLVPMDSINISATPSLSFILKQTIERQSRVAPRPAPLSRKEEQSLTQHSAED